MEGIHVLSIYYLLAFILIHLSGVFWSEFTSQQGIISRIISGKTHQSACFLFIPYYERPPAFVLLPLLLPSVQGIVLIKIDYSVIK